MGQVQANIRELKSRLSHYLRLTKAGESVIITERGHPIGHIVPIIASTEQKIEIMEKAGLLSWNNKRLRAAPQAPKTHGRRSVADLLIEDRE
jgi:prevent-host-death family protein